MSDAPRRLVPGEIGLGDLRAMWRDPGLGITLDDSAWPRVDAAAETVEKLVREGATLYGITTGFGKLAKTRIGADSVAQLQTNLVRSHCVGVGDPLPARVVRLVLVLKVASLARGHSGIRRDTLAALLRLIDAGAVPIIPAKGSVGASGDLAPLAHLAAVLIGEGEVELAGERLDGATALARIGLSPVTLQAKEGLALLNGSQVSTALALDGLFQALDAAAAALAAGGLSTDACLGTPVAYDPRIQALRGHPGQIKAAEVLTRLLAGSEIRDSHLACDRVQDPYSLRCQPQVMGAVLDQLDHAAAVLLREANAVSDNPLVFPDTGEVLSGGNFHAEPVALAADAIASAMSEIAALSERRTALLIDSNFSALPAFLVAEPGLNSGFMMAQVTAAALASELKQRAAPAATDSLPTSGNQEDHVSMATHAARRLGEMAPDLRAVVAIELLAAAQGIDFRDPLRTGDALRHAQAAVRARSAFLRQDRSLAPDIAAVAELIADGWFFEELLGPEERPLIAE
ncbi:histidine ammonia-lyase [Ferruginivarius sediminum]|uniref:Histidine ammonia-lyase n=1 Tax=Ferruginivarius sediminum TaxID=2661937 RepID=A0A369TAW9_9PROT|nr:histidine ammonia-lyase [Ferruginivarius sediminum]RDD62463.1 histidine ammonia-lyase [Ferruginivarius sediminum]